MNNVAKIETPDKQEAADFSASIIQVISNAAADPNVDIDKMERLIAMQERIEDRQMQKDFDVAFAAMQPELPHISADESIIHKGTKIADYASWAAIQKAITPILSKHGFSLTFSNSNTSSEMIVTAILKRGGHQATNTITLPADTSGAKNAVQAVGSSQTYGLRYAACPLVGVTISGQDNDAAMLGSHPISVQQYDELLRGTAAAGRQDSDLVNYLNKQGFIDGNDISELPAKHFTKVKNFLDSVKVKP